MKCITIIIGMSLIQSLCFLPKLSASVIIEGNIKNIPSNKVYLTNRGYASGPSFILKIYDSCTTSKSGYFYFEIKNIDESKYYSIEFGSTKIGWISLLPRKNEHIKINGFIKDHREIESITGSNEYVLREELDSVIVPYKKKLNNYADSSSFYYEKNPDSAKYFTRLNKLYDDTLMFTEMNFSANHPKSTLALHLLDENIFDVQKDSVKKILLKVDNGLKSLSLYKYLLDFVTTKEVATINSFPPRLDILDSTNKQKELDIRYYQNKIVLIDFWASWCKPCRENIPELKLLSNRLDSNKYLFISISIDSDKQSWKKALLKENMPWVNYIIDPAAKYKTLAKYSLESIPEYLLINSESKVILITYSIKSVEDKINLIINDKGL
ncbi:MAG: TlpA disulfide reductase family protein [Parafilimonas sp.]